MSPTCQVGTHFAGKIGIANVSPGSEQLRPWQAGSRLSARMAHLCDVVEIRVEHAHDFAALVVDDRLVLLVPQNGHGVAACTGCRQELVILVHCAGRQCIVSLSLLSYATLSAQTGHQAARIRFQVITQSKQM